ncbi:hypothetical protein ACO2Q0_04055 [Phenylobacterium sp. VNQ135]|uniref:hypothetical protein n=1 Tax=Phenylobacterium sp. VNQ135 TaxID=3400922 RepID=UPI003C11CC4B
MTVRRDGDVAILEGACRVEQAEILAGLMSGGVQAVDVSRCTALHAAVAQVLLAWRPAIRGAPDDAFLRDRLLPALTSVEATSVGVDDTNDKPSAEGREGTKE